MSIVLGHKPARTVIKWIDPGCSLTLYIEQFFKKPQESSAQVVYSTCKETNTRWVNLLAQVRRVN